LVPTSLRRSSRREPQEGANPTLPTMARYLEMFYFVCWTLVGLYVR
jgi:hypothetical protein